MPSPYFTITRIIEQQEYNLRSNGLEGVRLTFELGPMDWKHFKLGMPQDLLRGLDTNDLNSITSVTYLGHIVKLKEDMPSILLTGEA